MAESQVRSFVNQIQYVVAKFQNNFLNFIVYKVHLDLQDFSKINIYTYYW